MLFGTHHSILAEYNRRGGLRTPFSYPIQEERAEPGQPAASRRPRSYTRVLGRTRKRRRRNRFNPRVSSLEGGFHVARIIVDKLSLPERREGSRLPRTFQGCPRQPVAEEGGRLFL